MADIVPLIRFTFLSYGSSPSERQAGNFRARVAICILVLIALLTPSYLRAQCQPVTPKFQAAARQNPSLTQPEFFDEPKFTVAGVTETSNLGGHGSDAVWRTKEALAKDTVLLSKSKEDSAKAPTAAPSIAQEESLREAARQADNFEANRALGKVLLDEGKAREALPYLEQASRLNPDDSDMHHLLGSLEEKLGNPLEAVHQYQRAAELDPSETNLFDWGTELLLHHAPEPAIEVFTKGNHLFPRSTRMLVALGIAWYSRGSYDQAAACLCQASDVNPDDPNPYLFLGKLQDLETTPSEGVAERLARFARIQPENALANYYYAVSLWKRRKGPQDTETSAQVKSLLQRAVRLDPGLGAAYLQLGILYSEQNDLTKAIAAYEKAIEVNPQLEAAHYRLAQAYRQAGDKLKAQQESQRFEQLSKQAAQQTDHERREIQQFVYTLQGRASTTQPQ
jgi:tetratricopeptide (TPR) repeat protein